MPLFLRARIFFKTMTERIGRRVTSRRLRRAGVGSRCENQGRTFPFTSSTHPQKPNGRCLAATPVMHSDPEEDQLAAL